MKLTNTNEHIKTSGHKVLVYGISGAGKTTLASTTPHCIILSMESGLKSISHLSIPVIDITKDDNGIAFKTAKEKYNKFLAALQWLGLPEQKLKYRTVFIDSLTELASIIFTMNKDAMEASGKNDGFKVWGDYATQLSKLLRALRDADHYNVVFSCLEDCSEDDLKRKFYQPQVDGNGAKQSLLPIFDEVWRLIVDDKGVRSILTKPKNNMAAKSRSNALSEVEPPNLNAIFTKMNDHVSTLLNAGQEKLNLSKTAPIQPQETKK